MRPVWSLGKTWLFPELFVNSLINDWQPLFATGTECIEAVTLLVGVDEKCCRCRNPGSSPVDARQICSVDEKACVAGSSRFYVVPQIRICTRSKLRAKSCDLVATPPERSVPECRPRSKGRGGLEVLQDQVPRNHLIFRDVSLEGFIMFTINLTKK